MTLFLSIIGFSILILAHEFGHFWVARKFKMPVKEFGIGFPPRAWAKKAKDGIEYSINWLPIGGFVRIAGEGDDPTEKESDDPNIFRNRSVSQRAAVMIAGVAVNFILGWFLIAAALSIGTPPAIVVTGIQKNSPASTAGFKEGDAILGFPSSASFISYSKENLGKELTLRVLRDGRESEVRVTPRVNAPQGEGAIGLGVSDAGSPAMPIYKAAVEAVREVWFIVVMSLTAFGTLLAGIFTHGSVSADVMGPVGILNTAKHTGALGLVYLLRLMGLISVNLAVLNLMPFPALDGGRILFLAIERVIRRKLPQNAEAWVNVAGFGLLLLLILVITVRDVGRIFFS
jgi:regulator of sigma E protease